MWSAHDGHDHYAHLPIVDGANVMRAVARFDREHTRTGWRLSLHALSNPSRCFDLLGRHKANATGRMAGICWTAGEQGHRRVWPRTSYNAEPRWRTVTTDHQGE